MIQLNIGNFAFNRSSFGPGKRMVVWFKGCNLLCPGCINPQLQSFDPGIVIKPEELYTKIMSKRTIEEGITITGGEPFLQINGLYEFVSLLKQSDLSIQVYSGFYLEELKASDNDIINKILASIDVLIDGRFDSDRQIKRNYKGSDNQIIHFLSDRYTKNDYSFENSFEVIYSDGKLEVSGFYEQNKFLQNYR